MDKRGSLLLLLVVISALNLIFNAVAFFIITKHIKSIKWDFLSHINNYILDFHKQYIRGTDMGWFYRKERLDGE